VLGSPGWIAFKVRGPDRACHSMRGPLELRPAITTGRRRRAATAPCTAGPRSSDHVVFSAFIMGARAGPLVMETGGREAGDEAKGRAWERDVFAGMLGGVGRWVRNLLTTVLLPSHRLGFAGPQNGGPAPTCPAQPTCRAAADHPDPDEDGPGRRRRIHQPQRDVRQRPKKGPVTHE